MPKLRVRTQIWRSDARGQLINQIGKAVETGTIDHSLDSQVARQLNVTLKAEADLEEYHDYLVPVMTIQSSTQSDRINRLGLFVAGPTSDEDHAGYTKSTLIGRDLAWSLTNQSFGDWYTVPVGANIIQTVVQIIQESGVPPEQIRIQDNGKLLTTAKKYIPGTTRWEITADLLQIANYHVLWVDRNGYFRSEFALPIDSVTPVRQYTAEHDLAEVVPPIAKEPDESRLRNKVTVRRINGNDDPVWWTAVNDDPNSPASIQRIGERANPPFVDVNEIITVTEAKEMAEYLLSIGCSWYKRVALKTIIDPTAEMHETVELGWIRSGRTLYEGRWWRQAWSQSLDPSNPTMTHALNRVELFGV